ncbi:MAG: hypothetical protein JWR72_73 [Flavisolibacter sp.]|nr:hypothetical protein [Flavisolibacter sp.]
MKSHRLHSYLPRRSILFFAAALLVLSFLSTWYLGSQPSVKYQQRQLQHYVNDQQQDAQKLLADTALLRKLVLQSQSLKEFKEVEAKQYGVFLFAETMSDTEDPLFWNNQKILPPRADFTLMDGVYFQLLPNGYYIIQKNSLRLSGMTNNVIAYILIPVLHKYYLQTDYLQTRFVHDKDAIMQISVTSEQTEFPIKSIGGSTLFHIKRVAHSNEEEGNVITVILRILAFILLLVYVQLIAESINRRNGSVKAILFLTTILLGVRVALFLFPQLLSLRMLSLFDPAIYASNWLNRSLGDLLLNAVLICWIILFTWYSLGPQKKLPVFIKGKGIIAIGVASIFLLIFSTFQLANVVHDLVTASKVSFNVTDFFTLTIYSAFGFTVFALLSLSYYYFSRLLFRVILLAFPNLLQLYFAVAVIGLIFLTLRDNESVVLFQLPVLAWLVVYTLLLSGEGLVINRFKITIAGILFWIFIFSASLTLLVLKGNRQTELRTRKGIAEKYDQLSDPSRENILSIASTFFDNRYLKTNFPRFYSADENPKIRDSILTADLVSFSNPYNTQIYIYDSTNKPLYNVDGKSFAEINTLFNMQSKPAGIEDLYFIETSYDKFTYIIKRTVTDSTHFVGTFFILAALKQYQSSDALFPEFFRRVNRNDPENSPYYSYAVYKEGQLRNHSSKYAFAIAITEEQIPKGEMDQRVHSDESGDYDELWLRGVNKKVVVVAKKKDSLLESITLFSYLFCSFLFMVGVLRLFAFLLKLRMNRRAMNLFSGLNIRTQIHGTIIVISVLSFLIIGIATISFFIARYHRNNVERLSRTASITVKEMQKRVGEGKFMDKGFNFADSTARESMQSLVTEIADVHDVDANVYDPQGNLQVSSYNEVYTRGILSTKMHPLAYYRLKNMNEVQRVQEETMSSLKYLSIYTAIRDKQGVVYAYLNIPYFSSEFDLKQEISNFFVTIINLNAFIFLLAGVIALFITNKITSSFSVIGNKMKEITLGKTAEEIVWNSADEIGELVTQYNKMVHQLERSAEALAKSEREGAWREMARQVAHEIKNPLTPMKLSIQYLQKAIQANQPNIQVLTANVANTLIEQIDHLSKIAADFSQFANIGNKRLEIVDLHTILGSLVDLYSSNPNIDLQWNQHNEGLFIRTDKTHMNRLFTNLMTNAVDACMEKERCKIVITEEREFGFVVIAITDNGEGIPEEMQAKIFAPNFTTKTSGTGLGLAMCKSIVEQAGGEIWFQTTEGEGTTFFVRLPLTS